MKFQGDILNFYDFIQVFVFTTNHHLKAAADASDTSAGSVMLQEDSKCVDHPVYYFSKIFGKHQRNFSTIEKECLSLILYLQHFEIYFISSSASIIVFSDHNPLIFITKMKNKNDNMIILSLMLYHEFEMFY